MIDRRRRNQLAEIIRHFSSGQLTNREYEKQVDSIFEGIGPKRHSDLALWVVHSNVWFVYDDLRTHCLTGCWQLTPEARAEIARWVMFLYTDQEYEWPITSFISPLSCVVNIFTLGLWGWVVGPYREKQLAAIGDWDKWPFMAAGRYEEALQNPRLLHGMR